MTISSVGSSSLLQQLLQARASTSTQAARTAGAGDSSATNAFAGVGQNMPAGGRNAPPPPMQGWSSSGQGFSADTLASLIGSQQTDQTDRAAAMFADADTDGDGSVTSDELATAMAAHAPADLGGPPPGPPPSGASDAGGSSTSGSSDSADVNGDGVVSAAELAQSLRSSIGQLGSDVSADAADLMQKLLAALTSNLTGSTTSDSTSATAVDVAA